MISKINLSRSFIACILATVLILSSINIAAQELSQQNYNKENSNDKPYIDGPQPSRPWPPNDDDEWLIVMRPTDGFSQAGVWLNDDLSIYACSVDIK